MDECILSAQFNGERILITPGLYRYNNGETEIVYEINGRGFKLIKWILVDVIRKILKLFKDYNSQEFKEIKILFEMSNGVMRSFTLQQVFSTQKETLGSFVFDWIMEACLFAKPKQKFLGVTIQLTPTSVEFLKNQGFKSFVGVHYFRKSHILDK